MSIKPYAVGESNILVVGMEGVVEAMTSETVTIGGVTLPKRMGDGVRYLSMTWPESPCDREHCEDNGCAIDPDEDVRADLRSLVEAIESRHNDRHKGAFRFCDNLICHEAYEVSS